MGFVATLFATLLDGQDIEKHFLEPSFSLMGVVGNVAASLDYYLHLSQAKFPHTFTTHN